MQIAGMKITKKTLEDTFHPLFWLSSCCHELYVWGRESGDNYVCCYLLWEDKKESRRRHTKVRSSKWACILMHSCKINSTTEMGSVVRRSRHSRRKQCLIFKTKRENFVKPAKSETICWSNLKFVWWRELWGQEFDSHTNWRNFVWKCGLALLISCKWSKVQPNYLQTISHKLERTRRLKQWEDNQDYDYYNERKT